MIAFAVPPWVADELGIYDLPELTDEEREVLDEIDTDAILAKVYAHLPVEEKKPWAVADKWGNVIKRYKEKEEALADCYERNRRALQWGISTTYRVIKA